MLLTLGNKTPESKCKNWSTKALGFVSLGYNSSEECCPTRYPTIAWLSQMVKSPSTSVGTVWWGFIWNFWSIFGKTGSSVDYLEKLWVGVLGVDVDVVEIQVDAEGPRRHEDGSALRAHLIVVQFGHFAALSVLVAHLTLERFISVMHGRSGLAFNDTQKHYAKCERPWATIDGIDAEVWHHTTRIGCILRNANARFLPRNQ